MTAFRKHISQAIVLLIESRLGYRDHLWLAIGHLAEAESEVLADYFDLAERTRTERLKIIDDPWHNAELMSLISEATDLAHGSSTKKKRR